MLTSNPTSSRRLRTLWGVAALLLAACGGGQTEDGAARAPLDHMALPDQVSTTEAPGETRTQALLEIGAQLNAAELEQIAKTGVLPEPFDGPLLSGAEGSTAATLNTAAASKSIAEPKSEQKSAASRVAAFRFFNASTGAHFYTTSVTERDNVIATLPQFSYEGPAFYVSATSVPGLSPVHRFFNTQTGVHFYTISETERANVAANLPQFNYEGIGYYASTLSGTGYTPLYRFFVSARGFHFYTNSLTERDTIIATLPQYSYEGIGYYVLGDDWQTPAVPHTGITAGQCYRAGDNVLHDCSFQSVVNLNIQQDGRRTTLNTMSYSPVANQSSAECMRDNVTGLVWEVKTAAGVRAGSDTYRRTLGFFGDPTTTGTYLATVNNMGLCGYSDWRLPTMEELHGLVDFGRTAGPHIAILVFPNTQEGQYWTATDSASNADLAWYVRFNGQSASITFKSNLNHVRLVRGTPWVGQRYVVTTQAYPGDEPNNAAIDRKTGLTWRRCMEGQLWVGANCSGIVSRFTHEEALDYAGSQGVWRLPNAKELTSLADRSRFGPALDPVMFPVFSEVNFDATYTWSATPHTGFSSTAWYNIFSSGSSVANSRGNTNEVRLVYSRD